MLLIKTLMFGQGVEAFSGMAILKIPFISQVQLVLSIFASKVNIGIGRF